MTRPTATCSWMAAATMAAFTLFGLPSAMAAAPPSPGPAPSGAQQPATARSTFGIKPFGEGSPDRRPWLSYSASPGARVVDQVEVKNYGYSALRLTVYATDAFNTPSGGLDLLVAGKRPADIGTWVRTSRSVVVLPPRGHQVVRVALHIPDEATPGDHIGGLVASIQSEGRDQNGNRVSFDQRVATRIYIRVAGPLTPALSIESVRADWQGTHNPFGRGRMTLTYRVRNTGNVRLLSRQLVTVGSPLGDRDPVPLEDLPELLPGGSTLVSTTVHGLLPLIGLHAAVELHPFAPPGSVTPRPDIVRSRASVLAIPWTLFGIVAVLALATARALLTRRSRQRHPAKAASHRRRPTRRAVPVVKGT